MREPVFKRRRYDLPANQCPGPLPVEWRKECDGRQKCLPSLEAISRVGVDGERALYSTRRFEGLNNSNPGESAQNLKLDHRFQIYPCASKCTALEAKK